MGEKRRVERSHAEPGRHVGVGWGVERSHEEAGRQVGVGRGVERSHEEPGRQVGLLLITQQTQCA